MFDGCPTFWSPWHFAQSMTTRNLYYKTVNFALVVMLSSVTFRKTWEVTSEYVSLKATPTMPSGIARSNYGPIMRTSSRFRMRYPSSKGTVPDICCRVVYFRGACQLRYKRPFRDRSPRTSSGSAAMCMVMCCQIVTNRNSLNFVSFDRQTNKLIRRSSIHLGEAEGKKRYSGEVPARGIWNKRRCSAS